MKNTLEKVNSRWCDTKECIGDLEERIMETTQLEQHKEKQIIKWKWCMGPLRKHKAYQHCIIGVSKGQERERWVRNVLDKIVAEKFLNLKKNRYPRTGNTKSQRN